MLVLFQLFEKSDEIDDVFLENHFAFFDFLEDLVVFLFIKDSENNMNIRSIRFGLSNIRTINHIDRIANIMTIFAFA